MLSRQRALIDLFSDPASLNQRLRVGMLGRAGRAAPGRRYVLDWEFACFFRRPIDDILKVTPPGVRPYRPDAARQQGLIHIGYIKMRPGNLRDGSHPRGLPAFEELTWGIQAQPFERDWQVPYTFVANRLAGTQAHFRAISRDEDRYPIYDTDDIHFSQAAAGPGIAVVADQRPICTLSIGTTKVDADKYSLLPVPAEILKPGPNQELYRNSFNFLGLVRRLEADSVDYATRVFTFHDHPFFGDLFAGQAGPIDLTNDLEAVMMSRPGTTAVQIIGPTTRVR